MANKIKCTCGHSWDKSDSSKKDATVCHICGKDNVLKNGGWLDKYSDSGIIPQAQKGKKVIIDGKEYDTSSEEYKDLYRWGPNNNDGRGGIGGIGYFDKDGVLVTGKTTLPEVVVFPKDKDTKKFYDKLGDSDQYAFEQMVKKYGPVNITKNKGTGIFSGTAGHYNPFANQITINPNQKILYRDKDTYLAELAHKVQFDRQGKFDVMGNWVFNDLPDYVKHTYYGLKDDYDIGNTDETMEKWFNSSPYNDPSTVEYQAHSTIEPTLKDEFFNYSSDDMMGYNYNKFKSGGKLDKYGEEINANEGYSSAPKEWMGEGYSNVGRDYSPAWGGQFEEGGTTTTNNTTLTPIYTDDPNDPRLKAFKDSSTIYNYIQNWNNLVSAPNVSHEDIDEFFDKPSSVAARKLAQETKIKGKNVKSISVGKGSYNNKGLKKANANIGYLPKPQPVIYKPEPTLKPRPFVPATKIPMGEPTTGMQIQQRSFPKLDVPNVNMSGPYMVGYTDYDTQQGIDRGFQTAEERDAFYKQLSERQAGNYQPGQGNISSYYDVNRKLAMGGSLPGSTGFMYARTGAPSNGPYAKKTLPSAQSGLTQNQTKEEVTNTDDKPYLPYRVDYTDPETGKHESKWYEDEEASRYFFDHRGTQLLGVQGAQGYYEKPPGKKKPPSPTEQQRLKDQAELKGTTKSFYNQWYNSPMHAEMLKESLRKPFGTGLFLNKRVKQKTQDRLNTINNEMDLNLEPYPEASFDISLAGNVKNARPNLINISPFATLENQKGTSIHEGAHVTDLMSGIPRKDIKKMQKYANFNMPFPESLAAGYSPEDQTDFKNYVSKDTETRARVMNGKYILSQIGSQFGYDPFTQKLSKDQFYKAEQLSPEFKNTNDQLRSIYSDDEILNLHNTLSKSNNSQEQTMARNGGMTYYQNGLDWKPKSISKNGGWLESYAEGGQAEKICYDENGYRVPCADEAVPIEYTFDKNDPNLKKYNEIKNAEKIYITAQNELQKKGVLSEDEFVSMMSKYEPYDDIIEKYSVASPIEHEVAKVSTKDGGVEFLQDMYDFPIEKEYRFLDPSNMHSVYGPNQSVIGFTQSNGDFYPVNGTGYATKKEDLEFLKNQHALDVYLGERSLHQVTPKRKNGGGVPQAQTGIKVGEEVRCGPNQVYLEGTGCIDIRSRMYKELYGSGKLAQKGPDESVIFPTMEPFVVNSKLTEDQKRALLRKDMQETSAQNQTQISSADQPWYQRAFDIATHPGTAIRAYNKTGYIPSNLGAAAEDMGGPSSIINSFSPVTWAKGAYNAGKQFGSAPIQTTKDVLQGTGNLVGYGIHAIDSPLPGQTMPNYISPFGDAGTNKRALEFVGNVGEALPLLDVAPYLNRAINLSKESGLLSNTYKINPWAFKPNPENIYRGIGKGGMEDAFQSGVIRNNPNKFSTEGIRSGLENGSFRSPYFVEGKDFNIAEKYANGYVAETPLVRNVETGGLAAYPAGDNWGWTGAEKEMPLKDFKILKKDWLRGYKEVPKPIVDFSKYLTQEEAVASRAERLISQKNKPGWNEQLTPELEQKLSTAVERHNPASDYPGEKLGANTSGRTATEVSKDANLKGVPLNEANKARVAAHEVGHYYSNSPIEGEEWLSHFNLDKLPYKTKVYLRGKGRSTNYANEIRERAAQLKDYIAQKNGIPLNQDFVITQPMLNDAIKNYVNNTGLDNTMSKMLGALKDKKGLLKTMNKYALGTVPAVGGAVALQQKKEGGVVKDDNGYWNPDNWGKVVEIGSPNITMQDVYEPLIGESKQTGEKKLMLPGKNYKFANTKQVIERPIGKNGVNQQDEKVIEQLDQLTNFTNYNKPTKGGWLDKYN